jgi:hypothetical protein
VAHSLLGHVHLDSGEPERAAGSFRRAITLLRRAAPDLEERVAGDEQPRAVIEGVVDRDGHEQAGEHQPDERHAHGQRVRIEPVRPPRGHVPGVEDRKCRDDRLGAGAQIDVCDQVV